MKMFAGAIRIVLLGLTVVILMSGCAGMGEFLQALGDAGNSVGDMYNNRANQYNSAANNLSAYNNSSNESYSHNSGPRCPHDNNPLYPSGGTKIEGGTALRQYRCAAGHTHWVAY